MEISSKNGGYIKNNKPSEAQKNSWYCVSGLSLQRQLIGDGQACQDKVQSKKESRQDLKIVPEIAVKARTQNIN
jgi:hypothetical protein